MLPDLNTLALELCLILVTVAGHWILYIPCLAAKGKENVETGGEWEKNVKQFILFHLWYNLYQRYSF